MQILPNTARVPSDLFFGDFFLKELSLHICVPASKFLGSEVRAFEKDIVRRNDENPDAGAEYSRIEIIRIDTGARPMGAALNNFMNKFNEFKVLPAGKTFTIKATDTEAADAAREYLEEYNKQVRQLIQNSAGMSINVEDPEIRFGIDEISMAARGRKGFLKVNASVSAEVRWDGRANVTVRSADVPFISISPEKLNFVIEKPLAQAMGKVEEYAEIRSFKLFNGLAVPEAVKK